ncbi:MAG: ribonuclease III [Bacteroidetes bacterium ADurb.Bin408]|nr:MAG: ribonuclease III [Bacteroidetes bacterium ADurb.Bin408]
MDRHEQIKILSKRLKADEHSNELNKALTHSSYTESDENDNNSRFVYLGQFAFKGYVADLLYKFTPGTGTQLQHILGNLFKNEHLNTLYDSFRLEELIRYGRNFDAKAHRHIFVFGLLGFIHQYSPDELKQTVISRYFIIPNKHLFSHSDKSNDLQAQCNVISRILFQEPVFVEIVRNANGLWQTTVSIKDSVIACETSVSHRYSRLKTLKKAIKQLADDLYFIETTKPGFDAKQSLLQQIRNEKFQQQKE